MYNYINLQVYYNNCVIYTNIIHLAFIFYLYPKNKGKE